jgi:MFS family permease
VPLTLPTRLRAIGSVLAEPLYGRYVAGNAVSLIGSWLQRTAVGWLAWELTGSTGWVGLAAFANLFPTVVIGPFGGVLADRLPRRRIMLLTQSLLAAVACLLCILLWTGRMSPLLLVLLVAAQGIVAGIDQPARLALIPDLVSPRHLGAAVAVNSIVFNGARFVGPALAGLVLATLGTAAAFGLNALSYLAFIWALLSMRLVEPQRPRKRRSIRADLGEGLLWVARHPTLGPLMLALAFCAILVRPLAELLPGFAAQVFGGGVGTLAVLSSTIGIGAVAGGLWVAGQDPEKLLPHSIAALAGAAVAALVFASSPSLLIAVPTIACSGFFLIVLGVSAQTMVQLHAATDVRGRVMSLYGLIARGGPAIGGVLMGGIADVVGLRLTVAGGAFAFALVWLWLWRRRGQLAAGLRGGGILASHTS